MGPIQNDDASRIREMYGARVGERFVDFVHRLGRERDESNRCCDVMRLRYNDSRDESDDLRRRLDDATTRLQYPCSVCAGTEPEEQAMTDETPEPTTETERQLLGLLRDANADAADWKASYLKRHQAAEVMRKERDEAQFACARAVAARDQALKKAAERRELARDEECAANMRSLALAHKVTQALVPGRSNNIEGDALVDKARLVREQRDEARKERDDLNMAIEAAVGERDEANKRYRAAHNRERCALDTAEEQRAEVVRLQAFDAKLHAKKDTDEARRIDRMAGDVEMLGRLVDKHGAHLARDDQAINAHYTRLDHIEKALRRLTQSIDGNVLDPVDARDVVAILSGES